MGSVVLPLFALGAGYLGAERAHFIDLREQPCPGVLVPAVLRGREGLGGLSVWWKPWGLKVLEWKTGFTGFLFRNVNRSFRITVLLR